ncbi:DUF4328 domain-containing protein [Streptomyces sp. NPDC059491]|uniref:DUF4328 domain-containing protein n=1 Tax=Streptomyces sp. NPDC059491 TaxID=3346850 RepID=UPI0036BF3480
MLVLRDPNGLARAVVALLAGNIAFDALLGAVDVRDLTAVGTADFDPTSFGPFNVNVVVGLAFMVFLATAIVFVLWFHRLRRNAEVWAPDLQGRTPGFAIGCWFIPFGNLWIPRAIAVDIWRASRREPYAADGRGELALLNGWWTCWVVGTLVNWVSGQMYKTESTTENWTMATQWSLVGYVLDAVAAVLAILFVRRLTSMQHAKANGMIPAAQ